MFYKSVDLFYEPENLCNRITSGLSREYSEMSSFQKAFLCGLIKEKRPTKLVEIGVAGGGTTATILTCFKMLDYDAEMYSVDLSEKWYRTGKRETGFVAKEFMDQIKGNIQHKFVLGQAVPHVIDEIGEGIDFLILDTTHAMPGELLDFLICYPFLKNGCIVVLHDMINNLLSCDNNGIATKLLFDLMQGNKWYMREESLDTLGFSNIAAFEITGSSKENVNNVFSALSFTWVYALEERDAKKYTEIINRNYGIEYAKYLKKIMEMQKYTQIKKRITYHYGMSHEFLRMKWKKQRNVFIYGAGKWAEAYSEYAELNALSFEGYVVSDDQDICSQEKHNKKVYKLEDLHYSPDECSFVLALDRKHFAQVRRSLEPKGYFNIL